MNVSKFTRESYLLIYLHLIKYSEFPILGFLVGSKTNNEFVITKSFPVFHSIPIGPTLELAGQYAETLGSGDEKILGIYYSSDNHTESLPPYIQRIASSLHKILHSDILLLKIRDDSIGKFSEFLLQGTLGENKSITCQFLNSQDDISTLLGNPEWVNQHKSLLCDFEDHLNVSSKIDFTNSELLKSLNK